MEVSDAMQKCFKNGIKCYPVKTVRGRIIEYVINKKPYKFDKVFKNNKEINNAMTLSYIYLAKKILLGFGGVKYKL